MKTRQQDAYDIYLSKKTKQSLEKLNSKTPVPTSNTKHMAIRNLNIFDQV